MTKQPEIDSNAINSLIDLLPEEALELLEVKGNNLIETIGMDAIREVVLDVLTGRNIRNSTETLTRRRIAMMNVALVFLFFNGSAKDPNFVEKLPKLAADVLKSSKNKREKWIANWVLGLTGKAVQNVLRDDASLLLDYRDIYIDTCDEVVKYAQKSYGELSGTLKLSSDKAVKVDWLFILYLLNMVGSETLTIRGSEKSLYGKFFEKLILGSLLHVLGFEQVVPDNLHKLEKVFWLSSSADMERESDATILYSPGRGVRIDIGFIGRGNTEISLDKVSRYRREIEMGSLNWYMGTIIIVDRIGSGSNISNLAHEIQGKIIQMSGGYWPKRVALTLQEMIGFDHPLLAMEEDEIENYLAKQLQTIPLTDFINPSNNDTQSDRDS